MKVRDRLVLAVVAAIAVIAAMWLVVVSPERNQVTTLSGQIAGERESLQTAQAQLASSRVAVAGYVGHVHQIEAALRAIPVTPQEAALVRTIVNLAGTKVDFHNLSVQGAAAGAAGATGLTLSFEFNSTYGNLQNFLKEVDDLAKVDGTTLDADGRLFTIHSVSLEPSPPSSTNASVSAVVYEQAGPIGPTGATGASGAVTP
jgi:Tfp pilus assembly protein PilO